MGIVSANWVDIDVMLDGCVAGQLVLCQLVLGQFVLSPLGSLKTFATGYTVRGFTPA